MQGRICEAVEKFTRFDGDVWRLCVRDLLSSEVETLLPTSPCFLTLPLSPRFSFADFLLITGRFIGPPPGIPVFRSIGRVDDWDARTTDGNNWFELGGTEVARFNRDKCSHVALLLAQFLSATQD